MSELAAGFSFYLCIFSGIALQFTPYRSTCSTLDWLSFTSFRCTTRAYSTESAVALPVIATVGNQAGSASTMFSYSPPQYISKSGPPYIPGTRITIVGKNFGQSSLPTTVRIGSSSCSAPVMVLPHLSFSCLLPVPNTDEGSYPVSINIGGNIVTFSNDQITYDHPDVQRSLGHSQTTSSGSSFITLIGQLFGETSSSPRSQVGSTISSGSVWLSSSSVRGKISSGFGCLLPGIVSFYRGAVSSITLAFSYRPQIIAATTKNAFVTTGMSRITIVGVGLGVRRVPGSVSAKLGSSSCSSSQWSSHTHIACKLVPGSGHIYQIVSTAPGQSTCNILSDNLLYPHTSSYDAPSISAVDKTNSTFLPTGSSQILLFGSAFSIFDTCLRARLGRSAAVMTRWISQSVVLCKFPISRGSSFIQVLASTPSQVPPAAFGSHFISGAVRSALSAQPVPDSKVSLVLDGMVVATVTPDSIGYFIFRDLIDAAYVVVTEAPGLAPHAATVLSSMQPQNYTAAPGPTLQPRQFRIVLTWSTLTNDLDSQLLLPDGCAVYVLHTFHF
jgi:hypothetical protein